jgi:hypothetical protein
VHEGMSLFPWTLYSAWLTRRGQPYLTQTLLGTQGNSGMTDLQPPRTQNTSLSDIASTEVNVRPLAKEAQRHQCCQWGFSVITPIYQFYNWDEDCKDDFSRWKNETTWGKIREERGCLNRLLLKHG